MNKRFFTSSLLLFVGILAVFAQSKQDSLFLQQLPVYSPKLIEGKTYYIETDEQQSSPEFGKSRLYNEKDSPTFSEYQHLTNSVPFAEFGDKPILFKKVTMGNVKVGTENKACYILSFTCNKKTYLAYEFSENLLCAYYKLVEADYLNHLNKLLVGKTLYTKSANWEKYNENELNSNLKLVSVREGICKYCPVTVTRVVNDYDEKYIVLFKQNTQGNEYAFGNVIFDKDTKSDLNFIRYFTFTNPQEKYPGIPQEHWEQIMAQKVRKGFTPDEVKIAYGKPDEEYTKDDNETWFFYDRNNTDYVITFKEGVVDKVESQTSTYY